LKPITRVKMAKLR